MTYEKELAALITDFVPDSKQYIESLTNHLIEHGVFVCPFKIGDIAWILRDYKGHYIPQQGIVSEIRFSDDMRLMVTIKHIGRGEFGKKVFTTFEEAKESLKEENSNER